MQICRAVAGVSALLAVLGGCGDPTQPASTETVKVTATKTVTAKPHASKAKTKAKAKAKPHASKAPTQHLDHRYGTCREANAAGHGPYRRGVDPEYYWYQDRDHDGLVCER